MEEKNICTVLLITYNHIEYIKRAIESVLCQKTKYNYIIHIFDDGSTDGTSDIIREYAAKYPDKIIPFISQKNQGAQTNIWNAYKSVKTKYCAILECDDFWCDENKLEMQINALEEHPECTFCATQTRVLNTGDDCREKEDHTLMVTHRICKKKKIISKKNLPMGSRLGFMNHIGSRLIRTSAFDLDKLHDKEAFLYDNCQFYYLISKGPFYYIDKVMHCYIQTGCGSFSGLPAMKRLHTHIRNLLAVNEEINYELSKNIFNEIKNFISYYTDIQLNKESSLYKNFKRKFKRVVRYFVPEFFIDIIKLPLYIGRYVKYNLIRRN